MRAVSFLLVGSLVGTAGCISEGREQEIGDTLASEINPHLPLVGDPLLNAYVGAVGQTLATVSERPNLHYRFYIINTDAVNAFALPGGHVYVTLGLIDRTESGAEFASVLAHEIGHVAARHGVDKLQRQLRTGSLVNVLYDMILGGEPELLRENALQLANAIWTAQHSRSDEQEADRLAVRYLVRTGTEPTAVVSLLESLLVEEQARHRSFGPLQNWLSTHPLTADRIRDAEKNIERLTGEEEQMTELDLSAFDAFKALIARVPSGPSTTLEM
ncbi:MAG: M48 family metalloprotease [Gemmatimonas sp.]|nr:M48 family metalloprotease [Gemmatimonas sp.]